jgi:hypothetical protein
MRVLGRQGFGPRYPQIHSLCLSASACVLVDTCHSGLISGAALRSVEFLADARHLGDGELKFLLVEEVTEQQV